MRRAPIAERATVIAVPAVLSDEHCLELFRTLGLAVTAGVRFVALSFTHVERIPCSAIDELKRLCQQCTAIPGMRLEFWEVSVDVHAQLVAAHFNRLFTIRIAGKAEPLALTSEFPV